MNIPFLQDTTFTGIISTQDYKTSREWSQAFTLVQANSADWNVGAGRLWGTISGVLSTQTDLWSELSAKALNVDLQVLKTFVEANSAQWDESGDIIPTVVNFLSSNLVTVQTLNATSQILSGGVDISDIFITSAEESQTLTYDPESFNLSISRGNEVSLSSIPLAAPVQSVNNEIGDVIITPASISATPTLQISAISIAGDTNLPSGRNQFFYLNANSGLNANITLPFIGNQKGDIINITAKFITFGAPDATSLLVIRSAGQMFEQTPLSYLNLAYLQDNLQSVTLISDGSDGSGGWTVVSVGGSFPTTDNAVQEYNVNGVLLPNGDESSGVQLTRNTYKPESPNGTDRTFNAEQLIYTRVGSDALRLDTFLNNKSLWFWTDVPEEKDSPGIQSQVAFDNNHLYICVAPDKWVRVTVATNWS